jgi:hypothetical protein
LALCSWRCNAKLQQTLLAFAVTYLAISQALISRYRPSFMLFFVIFVTHVIFFIVYTTLDKHFSVRKEKTARTSYVAADD